MTWEQVRRAYQREFAAAKLRGETQETIAKRGGLKAQNMISKMLRNHNQGPQVQTLVRAVEGLGIKLSDFFADIEKDLQSDLSGQESDVTSATYNSRLLREATKTGVVDAPSTASLSAAALKVDILNAAGRAILHAAGDAKKAISATRTVRQTRPSKPKTG